MVSSATQTILEHVIRIHVFRVIIHPAIEAIINHSLQNFMPGR